eukprot:scaffold10563_cov76-Amphora_coffeaeformis.AAC.1
MTIIELKLLVARLLFVNGFPHDDHRTQVTCRKTPFREWVPFFNDSFALDHESSSRNFYRVDLLDIVFSHSPIESLKTKVIPSSLLSAQGTFMAKCWMQTMAQNMPVKFHKQGEVDNKDSDSVCTAETEDTTLSGSSVKTDLLSF